MSGRSNNRRKRPYRQEEKVTNLISKMEAMEEFQRDVLPKLRKALKEGVTTEKLYAEFGPLAAARAITIALTDEDSGKALAAIKEMQDRAFGKPTERVEQTHKYSGVKDEELDALVKSKLEAAGFEVDSDDDDELLKGGSSDGRRPN